MKVNQKQTIYRVVAFLALSLLLLSMPLLATGSQAGSGTAVAQVDSKEDTADVAKTPAQPESEKRIFIGDLEFDPLTADLATVQSLSTPKVNDENQGLFLLQFNGSPNDAMREGVASFDITYVQYVPDNAYIVWTTPRDLARANSLATVRWTGSFYSELRTGLDVSEATAEAGSSLMTLEAEFIDDGSLAELETLIKDNGGAIIYRQPVRVMDETLPVELWNFTVAGSALQLVSSWPGLVNMSEFNPPLIDDWSSNAVQAFGSVNRNYKDWLADTGYDGTGVRVAIFDTGVDWDHPDLDDTIMTGQEMGGYAEHFDRDGKPQEQPGSDGGLVAGGKSGHGTHVAGTVAGTGKYLEIIERTGLAPGAAIHAVDAIVSDKTVPFNLNKIVPEAVKKGSSLSNNSYGFGHGTGYTLTSSNIDRLVLDTSFLNKDQYSSGVTRENNGDREPFIMLYSAGNEGGGGKTGVCPPKVEGKGQGPYPCINSIGVYGQAKNVITVGASNSPHYNGYVGSVGVVSDWYQQIFSVAPFSSRGPAGDGRIKPDVLGVGNPIISTENRFVEEGGHIDESCADSSGLPGGDSGSLFSWCYGTSMATPSVAGVVALFNQFWRERVGDLDATPILSDQTVNPEPATVKAALIATATRMSNTYYYNDGFGHFTKKWPNEHEGWGRVSAERLLDPPEPMLFFENPRIFDDTGDAWSVDVRPANPAEKMRMVLVWSDAPGAGSGGSARALVNNLDLLVTRPGTTEDYCGNNFETINYGYSWDCSENAGGNPKGLDYKNNVEYVLLNPENDTYNIQVLAREIKGNGVPEYKDPDSSEDSDQNFSLVCYNCVEAYYVDDSVDDGLVAYWKFDEGDGTTVFNSLGANYPLTINAGTTKRSTDLPPSYFYNFGSLLTTGANPLALGDLPAFKPPNALSIAMWVKPTGRPDTFQTLMGKHGSYLLELDKDGKIQFQVWDNSNKVISVTSSSDLTVPLNRWTHVAAVWQKDGTQKIYIHGGQIGRIASAHSQFLGSKNNPVVIGERFSGLLDEVRFYNQSLDEDEILRLASGKECETSGTHWSEAFRFVSCGLEEASNGGGEVRVAQGTYKPGTNRDATFRVTRNVRLIGGYEGDTGFEGYDGDRRDWLTYPTILSGDLDHNDGTGVDGLTGRNSYHVVRLFDEFTLDGFIIEHGLANEPTGGRNWGAGIINHAEVSRTLRNLIIRDNLATDGAGLYAWGNGPITLRQVQFLGNKALGNGGGAMFWTKGAKLINSVFSGNKAQQIGAAFSGGSGPFSMYNSTLYGNEAATYGGLFVQGATEVEVYSSILYGNKGNLGPQFGTTVTNVTVQDSTIEGGYPGNGNRADDPLLADPDGEDNIFGTIDDNLHLSYSSPAIDSAAICTRTKIDGNFDGTPGCDRGAYEFGSILVVDDDGSAGNQLGYVIEALQGQALNYEVWTGKPGAARLSGHPRVLWVTSFLGGGPTGASEAVVGNWLDQSRRCLLLSSAGYLDELKGSPNAFAKQYFGLGSGQGDQAYKIIEGEGGFNDYYLQALYPDTVLSHNDYVEPDGGTPAKYAFKTNNGKGAGISLKNNSYKTMYLGFGLKQISTSRDESTLHRGEVLTNFFEDCEQTLVTRDTGALSLTVNANPLTYSSVGEKISYTYSIENPSSIQLSGPFMVRDDVSGVTDPCGSGPLAPGGKTSCTATYTVTQADLDAGLINNIATVETDNGLVRSQGAGATITADTVQISLGVSTDRKTYGGKGDKIKFTYTIRNEGDAKLDGPFTVTDNKLGTTNNCGSGPLASGAETSCQKSYTVTQADEDAGSISNLATVSGNGQTSEPTSITLAQAGGLLGLEKSANRETFSAVGDKIVYTYTLSNDHDAPLAGPFAVNDDKLGTIDPCGSGPLAPGAETSCKKTYTVTQGDLDAGFITNRATASGDGQTSEASSVTVLLVLETGSLSLSKSADRETFNEAGDKIVYTYVIKNTGSSSLPGKFTVEDDKLGTIDPCGSGPLAPGAETSCQKTYTVTQDDVVAGSVSNGAIAKGSGATSSPFRVTVKLNGSLSLVKSADQEHFSEAGEEIVYTYVIKNAGSITLPGPFTINDDRLGLIDPCGSGPLAPGAETSCQATHTVTESNILTGSITNVATANGNGLTSLPDEVTVSGPDSPSGFRIMLPAVLTK